jgi:nitrogen fixation protein
LEKSARGPPGFIERKEIEEGLVSIQDGGDWAWVELNEGWKRTGLTESTELPIENGDDPVLRWVEDEIVELKV